VALQEGTLLGGRVMNIDFMKLEGRLGAAVTSMVLKGECSQEEKEWTLMRPP